MENEKQNLDEKLTVVKEKLTEQTSKKSRKKSKKTVEVADNAKAETIDVANSSLLDKRTRKFSMVSYIEPDKIERFLRKSSWIQHWAFCTHDKDVLEVDECGENVLKEKHTHILLYTYDAKTSRAVTKIFHRYSVELYENSGKAIQNTMCEPCSDMVSQYRYLIHKDDKDKVQYDVTERKTDDIYYWEHLESTNGLNESSSNVPLQIVNDMLRGMSTYELIEKYKGSYAYHVQTFSRLVRNINYEVNSRSVFTFRDMCQLLLEGSPILKQEHVTTFFMVLDYINSECLTTYNCPLDMYLTEKINNIQIGVLEND